MGGRAGRVASLPLTALLLAGCAPGAQPAESSPPPGPTRVLVEPDVNYAAASRYGDLVFTAGHLPDGPRPRFADQVENVLDQLEATLEASGAGLDTLLKVNVYLADFDDWEEFNAVYVRRFARGTTPPRTTVQVARLGFDAPIEIDAIAHVRAPSP